jgi:autotransporter passenger strand-loop-strand repeat protein
VQAPDHGTLEWLTPYPTLWSGGPSWYLQPVTQFTQNDLHNGWFAYVNDFTSGASDSFSFTVSDGFGGTIGLTTVAIPILPVNPLVLRINSGAFVTTGGQSTISPDWLRVEDNAPNPNFTYTVVGAPQHGTLSVSGQAAATFTQNDVYSHNVVYKQDGDTAQSDQILISVTDTYGNSIPDLIVPITIAPSAVDRNTGAIVGIGQSTTIDGTNLDVADPGLGSNNRFADTPSALYYAVTAVAQHGVLSVNGTVLQSGDQFSQQQLDDGLLTYTEDGSIAGSDSFGFSISDAFVHNNFGSGTFAITIVSIDGGPIFTGGATGEMFFSGPGNNYVVGDGKTTVSYAEAPVGVTIDLVHGTAANGYGGTDTLSNIHSVIGTQYDDTVITDGSDTVIGGGGTDTVVFSGAISDYSIGASGGNVVISGGGSVDILGGITFAEFSNDTRALLPGAIAIEMTANGGQTDVYGTLQIEGATTGAVVESGGSGVVSPDGVAVDTVVSSGATLIVDSGGLASSTTIFSGGSETVSSGGTDEEALIQGGSQFDYGRVSGATIFMGVQTVLSGGVTVGTTAGSGSETVLLGEVASATVISAGGSLFVSAGGSASTTSAGSGGTQIIFGTEISGTIAVSGLETIGSGGVATSDTVWT